MIELQIEIAKITDKYYILGDSAARTVTLPVFVVSLILVATPVTLPIAIIGIIYYKYKMNKKEEELKKKCMIVLSKKIKSK